MKKLPLLLAFVALGLFSLGCEPQKAKIVDDSSDHMTADSGEEKPAAPAAEPKPEEKPAAESKPEDKPATETKPEEKPATEATPEEKPASEAKPEEKPAETPKS